MQGTAAGELLQQVEEQKKAQQKQVEVKQDVSGKQTMKGVTNRITLQLFKEGHSPRDIASKRCLTLSTIESHLISFIATGEIKVDELVNVAKIDIILNELAALSPEEKSITPVKNKLGDDFSFNDIRAVLHHREWLQQNEAARENN